MKARTQALNLLQCRSSKQKGSDQQVKKIILADNLKELKGALCVLKRPASKSRREKILLGVTNRAANLRKRLRFGYVLGKAHQHLDTS